MEHAIIQLDGLEVPVEFEVISGRELYWKARVPGRAIPLTGFVSGKGINLKQPELLIQKHVKAGVDWVRRAAQKA
jgi:hypothetical protein